MFLMLLLGGKQKNSFDKLLRGIRYVILLIGSKKLKSRKVVETRWSLDLGDKINLFIIQAGHHRKFQNRLL